jgi:hypothetical protein
MLGVIEREGLGYREVSALQRLRADCVHAGQGAEGLEPVVIVAAARTRCGPRCTLAASTMSRSCCRRTARWRCGIVLTAAVSEDVLTASSTCSPLTIGRYNNESINFAPTLLASYKEEARLARATSEGPARGGTRQRQKRNGHPRRGRATAGRTRPSFPRGQPPVLCPSR